eukprot:TRINITY_DN4242_c2_g1_i2.p1 TRINITY_DN4242_c2_g1~~TRINITY_DN4242_c2_g1_i2.p1  ORF type:complete len:320 (-),score=26.83 TRINITY_DN4242_c2_g1_i2:127-1086(-)
MDVPLLDTVPLLAGQAYCAGGRPRTLSREPSPYPSPQEAAIVSASDGDAACSPDLVLPRPCNESVWNEMEEAQQQKARMYESLETPRALAEEGTPADMQVAARVAEVDAAKPQPTQLECEAASVFTDTLSDTPTSVFTDTLSTDERNAGAANLCHDEAVSASASASASALPSGSKSFDEAAFLGELELADEARSMAEAAMFAEGRRPMIKSICMWPSRRLFKRAIVQRALASALASQKSFASQSDATNVTDARSRKKRLKGSEHAPGIKVRFSTETENAAQRTDEPAAPPSRLGVQWYLLPQPTPTSPIHTRGPAIWRQ